MKRRDFLRGVLLASSTPALLACTGSEELEPLAAGAGDGRIIIIGAGISGIAAARRLRESGADVLILEARNRVGGRMYTANVDGAPVDFGAAWIEGKNGNPMIGVAAELGLTVREDENEEGIFQAGVGWFSDEQIARAEDFVDTFDGELRRLRRLSPENASFADGINTFIKDEELSGAEAEVARFVLETAVLNDEAGDADRLSLDWYDEDEWYGPIDSHVAGGYGQIPVLLAQGLPIEFEKIVWKIEATDAGVRVFAGDEVYDGSAALVTVPLGVLKRGAIEFSPPLPERKLQAIDRLDMGTLEKIVLRFDVPFWTERTNDFYYYGSDSPIREFVDVTPTAGAPTLGCFLQGASGQALLAQGVDAAAAEATRILREVFPDSFREPTAIAITGWAADPFAGGSYSYTPVGASFSDFEALASPSAGRIAFAGEATDAEYHSAVHAAYSSGLREASRILASSTRGS